MNKIRTIAPLVILVLLVIAGAAYAQQVTKVAIINSQKAFETSAEGKKALAQMQDRDTKIKNDIQKLDDAIRLLENKLSTGRLTMTPEALAGIQSDIEKKSTERKRYEEDATRDGQAFANNLIAKIRAEMVTIIENLAKERGLDLILDAMSSGVVTASPTIDITDEVVRRYDQSKAATPPVKKYRPPRKPSFRGERVRSFLPGSLFPHRRRPFESDPDPDDLGPAPDADGRAPRPRPARHVIVRVPLPEMTPVELVDQAVDEIDREDLPVVRVARDLEVRSGLLGLLEMERLVVEDEDRQVRRKTASGENAADGQAFLLNLERARVPPPDEDESSGHIDGFILQDRDAAGPEAGQVPLEAAVELVVPRAGEESEGRPELAHDAAELRFDLRRHGLVDDVPGEENDVGLEGVHPRHHLLQPRRPDERPQVEVGGRDDGQPLGRARPCGNAEVEIDRPQAGRVQGAQGDGQ